MSTIRWIERAVRHERRRWARLHLQGEEHVVLIENLSRTGVRVKVARGAQVRVTDAVLHAEIFVKIDDQPRALPSTLVRVCSAEGEHIDLAFRFVNDVLEEDQVHAVESVIYPPRE